jgi:hypothetical protein
LLHGIRPGEPSSFRHFAFGDKVMRNAVRWIAFLLLQATVLFEVSAQSEFDQSTRSADQGRWMPTSDVQPVAALDTQNGVTRSPGVDWGGSRTESPRAEIGSIAQGFGTSRIAATDNAKAPPGDPENATLGAIKALHEEVKALEARIAAQDARIAMLERALENYTARNR